MTWRSWPAFCFHRSPQQTHARSIPKAHSNARLSFLFPLSPLSPTKTKKKGASVGKTSPQAKLFSLVLVKKRKNNAKTPVSSADNLRSHCFNPRSLYPPNVHPNTHNQNGHQQTNTQHQHKLQHKRLEDQFPLFPKLRRELCTTDVKSIQNSHMRVVVRGLPTFD